MPRANAKASKKSASAEEQELLRLRKELMEKQAKLKRVLAQEKRQGSGVLQAVREPPVVVLSRAERDRDEFCGMRAELARVLTAARADRVNVTGGSRTARSRAKSRVRAFPAALSGRARRAVASPARCELAL